MGTTNPHTNNDLVGGEKKRLEGRIVIAQGLSIHQREEEESSQGLQKDPIRTERLTDEWRTRNVEETSRFRSQIKGKPRMSWWESCYSNTRLEEYPSSKWGSIETPPSVQNPRAGRSRSGEVTFQRETKKGGRRRKAERAGAVRIRWI